ncbi:MAG: O-antigen ligase family protein [Cyanobacteria bacterium J06632_22]
MGSFVWRRRVLDIFRWGWLDGDWQDRLWFVSFIILPFASYVSLGLLIGLSVTVAVQHRKALFGWLGLRGYGWLSLGLLISAAIAPQPGNALLQAMNFLPYFLMLGAFVVRYQDMPLERRVERLLNLAQSLLLVSLPFSVLALVEYGVKFPAIAAQVSDWAIFQWAFDVSYSGHHASAMLGYHNILSAYLVIVLSLGLGLLTQLFGRPRSSGPGRAIHLPDSPMLTAGASGAAVVGVFCSGSRNGLLITVFLLLLVGCCLQRNRWVRLASSGFAISIVLGVLGLGAGGRQLSVALMTQDPRVGIWQIALQMIHQRPILGWGLGSFGHLYVPGSVQTYEHIHHAHNLWLYLASETGIPLTLGFCWVIGMPLYRALKIMLTEDISHQHRAGLFSYALAFMSCMLFGLFDVPLFDSRINVLGWLLLAGLYLLTQPTAESKETPSTEPI